MTAKELAQCLNGRDRGSEITRSEEKGAEAAGLVVAFGESDDLLEFRGAIYDEVGAYAECVVHLLDGDLTASPECCESGDECPLYRAQLAKAKRLKAVWHDEGNPCWTIETDIPHETFNIYEDSELFSVGIVFSAADTMEEPPDNPLTLAELRRMEGEPVYDGLRNEWYIVESLACDDEDENAAYMVLRMTDGSEFIKEIAGGDDISDRFYRRKLEA